MSYRDKTFCGSDCENESCHRFITESVWDNSEELGLPLAQVNFSSECDEYIKPKEKQDENN